MVTFSTNLDTPALVRDMATQNPDSLRILLETDAPYMIPSNIYSTLESMKGRLPLSHSAMIPWTADFLVNILGENWNADKVLRVARDNARNVYGI